MWGYVVADLVGPDLCIVDVVVFIGEVAVDHIVYFLLHERTDVIEYRLFLFRHSLTNQLYLHSQLYKRKIVRMAEFNTLKSSRIF